MLGLNNSIYDIIAQTNLNEDNAENQRYDSLENGENNQHNTNFPLYNNHQNQNTSDKYKSWVNNSQWDGGIPDQWTAFDALLSSTRSLITSDNKMNINGLYNMRTLLTNHASPQFTGIYLDEVADALHITGVSDDHVNFLYNMVLQGDNREKRRFSEHLLDTVNAVLNRPMSADEFMNSVNDFIDKNKRPYPRDTSLPNIFDNDILKILVDIIKRSNTINDDKEISLKDLQQVIGNTLNNDDEYNSMIDYLSNELDITSDNVKRYLEDSGVTIGHKTSEMFDLINKNNNDKVFNKYDLTNYLLSMIKGKEPKPEEPKTNIKPKAKTSRSLREDNLEDIFRQTLNSNEYNSFITQTENALGVSRSDAENFIKDVGIKIGDKRWDIIKDLDVNNDCKFNGHDYNEKYSL